MIRNAFILCALCVLGYGIGYAVFHRTPKPFVQTLPEFEITTLDGTRVSNETLKGQIVLMNFWATWCAPCVKEMPALITLADNNPNIVLLAISYDLDTQAIETFMDKHRLRDQLSADNIMIALDTQGIGTTLFDVHKLPETLIIDYEGIIRDHVIGAKWTVSDIQKILDGLKQ